MTKKLPENIQKWVDALRSGKYTQQQGTLKGPDGYCCLGVYCSIMGEEPPENSDPRYYKLCRESIKRLVVAEGIDMNDKGKSFLDIADMIEEKYLKEDS